MECAGHPFTLEFFECDGDTLYRVKIICSRIVEQKTEVRGRYKRDSKFLCPLMMAVRCSPRVHHGSIR